MFSSTSSAYPPVDFLGRGKPKGYLSKEIRARRAELDPTKSEAYRVKQRLEEAKQTFNSTREKFAQITSAIKDLNEETVLLKLGIASQFRFSGL